jgi:hypothetical protein
VGHEDWQEVVYDRREVRWVVVQREHRVVLHCCPPDDVGVCIPLLEGLQDPVVLGVSPCDPRWVGTSCLS